MRVPTGDNEMERCIRAHEMMHAKISPEAEDFKKWINRKIATERGLLACEELRVNLMCQRAGFDMMNHLSDGGETADGERIAINGTWADAVYSAIACAGTASQKKFLTGIRRHNRVWGKALLSICKRAVKDMEKQRALGSTDFHRGANIAPYGFAFTESLAEWVDRIAKMDAPDAKQKKNTENKKTQSSNQSESDSNESGDDEEISSEQQKIEDDFLEKIKKIPPKTDGIIPSWDEIRLEKLPLPKITRGSIGKKRVASNVGKSPRRLHRYMSDPEKRIFDKTSHGMGGVVVIDASGSMNLSKEQVRLLVEASPGATVVAYSTSIGGQTPNMWVLADKGRMVESMPDGLGKTNGIDFPAIEWAVKNRQRSNSPVLWVTDGGVTGKSGAHSETLGMQCVNYCLSNNITVIQYVEDAIVQLKNMQRGIKAKSQWPNHLKRIYKDKTGSRLI